MPFYGLCLRIDNENPVWQIKMLRRLGYIRNKIPCPFDYTLQNYVDNGLC